MIVPDFMIWHCAGCDKPAEGKVKPCECPTNVGVRQGPNGKREQTWWNDPPQKLWVVGKFMKKSQESKWTLEGVYTNEAKARAVCDTRDHFINEISADTAIPDGKVVPERPWDHGGPRH